MQPPCLIQPHAATRGIEQRHAVIPGQTICFLNIALTVMDLISSHDEYKTHLHALELVVEEQVAQQAHNNSTRWLPKRSLPWQ